MPDPTPDPAPTSNLERRIRAGLADLVATAPDLSSRRVELDAGVTEHWERFAATPDCGRLEWPPFAGGATATEAALRFAHDTEVSWLAARVADEDISSAPCFVTLEGEEGEPRVTVQVTGSRGRYGVVGALGAVATEGGTEGVLRVSALDGVITVDDTYWCPECRYRLTTLTYEGVAPAMREGTDGGSAPRQLRVGDETPDNPGLLLVTTYARERLVEVSAVVLPPGDFTTRSF